MIRAKHAATAMPAPARIHPPFIAVIAGIALAALSPARGETPDQPLALRAAEPGATTTIPFAGPRAEGFTSLWTSFAATITPSTRALFIDSSVGIGGHYTCTHWWRSAARGCRSTIRRSPSRRWRRDGPRRESGDDAVADAVVDLDRLRLTGREAKQIALVEAYAKAQGLFRTADSPDATYSETMELDLSTVLPSLAGRGAGKASAELRRRYLTLSLAAGLVFAVDLWVWHRS